MSHSSIDKIRKFMSDHERAVKTVTVVGGAFAAGNLLTACSGDVAPVPVPEPQPTVATAEASASVTSSAETTAESEAPGFEVRASITTAITKAQLERLNKTSASTASARIESICSMPGVVKCDGDWKFVAYANKEMPVGTVDQDFFGAKYSDDLDGASLGVESLVLEFDSLEAAENLEISDTRDGGTYKFFTNPTISGLKDDGKLSREDVELFLSHPDTTLDQVTVYGAKDGDDVRLRFDDDKITTSVLVYDKDDAGVRKPLTVKDTEDALFRTMNN